MSRYDPETRRLSAALFGNEKMVEVVLFIEGSDDPTPTAQVVSSATGIGHSMVRDVMVRLVNSGVLDAVPKVGGSRSPQYYRIRDEDAWRSVVDLASWAAALGERRSDQR